MYWPTPGAEDAVLEPVVLFRCGTLWSGSGCARMHVAPQGSDRNAWGRARGSRMCKGAAADAGPCCVLAGMRRKRDVPSQRGGASASLRRPLHRPCKAAPPGARQGVRPARHAGPFRPGRGGGRAAGAVCVPAARRPADWIGIGRGTVKPELATPFGRFKVRRTLACIGILCKGRSVSLGKVPAFIPEKDIVQLGNRPYIVIGRSNVFNQYSVKFDDYRQILTMERIAHGQAPPAGADAAQAVGALAGGGGALPRGARQARRAAA